MSNVTLTTTQVLTSAWFGNTAYYGYDVDGGVTSVTVTALGAGGVTLASDTINIPPNILTSSPTSGYGGYLASDPVLLDTSNFLNLVGITGYTISGVATSSYTGGWVADDLTFVPATAVVPEPSIGLGGLLSLGFMGAVYLGRRLQKY